MSLRRFQRYPAYKDSGIEWLGETPVHWECLALARVTIARCDGPFGSALKSEHYVGSGVRVVRLQNIGWAEFLDSDQAYLEEGYASDLGEHSVLGGDLLIAGLGDEGHPVGRACTAPEGIEPAIVKADCFRFRLDQRRLIPRFASYQLSATALAAGSLATGATRSRMNLTSTAARKLTLPPRDEQLAIATFLDREITRIDALVAKKERLLELLQEKRTALITLAVTKGLDAGVPMKDSGVEWLGKIPAHWKVTRTKFAARLRSGHTPSRQHPEYWQDCTIPWFGLADVWQIRDGRIECVTETAEKISEVGLANSAARLLPQGTVILSRTASVGFSAILGVPMATTQDFVNWVCGPHLRPAYLLYVFRSMQHEFRRLTMGSTHQTIYMPAVGAFCTAIPPTKEQDRIVAVVQEQTQHIDALEAKVFAAIDRLKEFRTALISAAVTGKIDVREEAA
jgi:type I restriction enzyme S subunit